MMGDFLAQRMQQNLHVKSSRANWYSSAWVINVTSGRVRILNIKSSDTYQGLEDSVYYHGFIKFYKGSNPLLRRRYCPCRTQIYYPSGGVYTC